MRILWEKTRNANVACTSGESVRYSKCVRPWLIRGPPRPVYQGDITFTWVKGWLLRCSVSVLSRNVSTSCEKITSILVFRVQTVPVLPFYAAHGVAHGVSLPSCANLRRLMGDRRNLGWGCSCARSHRSLSYIHRHPTSLLLALVFREWCGSQSSCTRVLLPTGSSDIGASMLVSDCASG